MKIISKTLRSTNKNIPSLDWTIKLFEELTLSSLYEILHIRSKVFVVEQADIYLDVDNRDQLALHVIGKIDDELVAYCRVINSNANHGEASIGRVIVAQEYRGLEYAKELITRALKVLADEEIIRISAQSYLQEFYEAFGFEIVGNPYLDGTIEHIDMEIKRGEK